MNKRKSLVNTKNMILFIIVSLIILLFVPISIRILYDDKYSDIDIYLFSFIRHKFDLDKFIKKFINDKNNKLSFRTLFNNVEMLLNSKRIFKDICNKTKIDKCTIILKDNYDDIYKFIVFWNIASRFSFIIKKYFKNINNEYYMITNSKDDLSVEIIFKVNIWKIFFVIIKNYKEVLSLIKIRRRQKKNGTPNM